MKTSKKGLLPEIESWNIGKLHSNDEKSEVKPACKDKKSKEICQNKKNKHNGKGCTRKRTKKLCKETCGLCRDGELNIISSLMIFKVFKTVKLSFILLFGFSSHYIV